MCLGRNENLNAALSLVMTLNKQLCNVSVQKSPTIVGEPAANNTTLLDGKFVTFRE
jgi:hypothetical protein